MRQYRYSGESRGFMVKSIIQARIYSKPEEEKIIVKDYKERQHDKIPIGQVQFLNCRIHEGEPTTPARVFEITAPDPVTYLWGEDCSTQIYFGTYEETKSILQKRVNEYEKAINWGQSINEAEYEVVRRAIHDETLTCEYDAVKIMEVQEPEIYFAKKITLYDAMWIFLTVKAEKVLFQSGRVDIEQMLVKRNNRYYHLFPLDSVQMAATISGTFPYLNYLYFVLFSELSAFLSVELVNSWSQFVGGIRSVLRCFENEFHPRSFGFQWRASINLNP